jgi:hypothetical protein
MKWVSWKTSDFVSDLAVIGIYYFKDIAVLKKRIAVGNWQ